MDNSLKKRKVSRQRRLLRVRKRLKGSALKPRLTVSKTNKHLYAQLIDDDCGQTLVGLGTLSKECQKQKACKEKSKEAARFIGQKIAELAKEKQIEKVVFDRGRFKFHGVIAELAKAAREAGLQF